MLDAKKEKIMITHKCAFDERRICEQCEVERRNHEYFEYVYAPAANILHQPLPEDLEIPEPFELGTMEALEWN